MKTVRYTPDATEDLLAILRWVGDRWGERSAEKLLNQVIEAEEAIAHNPLGFPEFEARPVLRKCVVVPQTSLFYRVFEDEIVIAWVFDNRMNPNRLSARK